jgi:hypothetical protein
MCNVFHKNLSAISEPQLSWTQANLLHVVILELKSEKLIVKTVFGVIDIIH